MMGQQILFVICQPSHSAVVDPKAVLVKALSKGNGGKSEVELNSVGSHIVNVFCICRATICHCYAKSALLP